MTESETLAAIAGALEKDPSNSFLWGHYAELLVASDRDREALDALRRGFAAGLPEAGRETLLVGLLRRTGNLAEALVRAESYLGQGDDPALRRELALILKERGQEEEAREHESLAAESGSEKQESGPLRASVSGEGPDADEWAEQFDWSGLRVTFDEVAGLEEVKRQIRLRIIAPFQNPEIYRAYRRKGGGGLLLYGPPGCGKTYIARATAGELAAEFITVSLHEVLDQYYGQSEKMVHHLFEEARRKAPAVIFFDEFDAIGSSRGRCDSQYFRTLVNQILSEMDGMAGHNEDLLLFAATNMPWSVDPAFRRPGRFDRVLFVPPPDRKGRERILELHCGPLPGGERIDRVRLAKETSLYTGADLKAVCENAAEYALERSLEAGAVQSVVDKDFRRALGTVKSTAMEWLASARNHARYANEGGQYDDLAEFLKKVKKW